MIYTKEMFDEDFKSCHNLDVDCFDYEYFEALDDIQSWDGKWDKEEKYMSRNVKTGEIRWIHSCNIHNNVKKGEVFIAGVCRSKYSNSVSVCRATGVHRFKRKSKHKREVLLAQEVNRIRFKKERPIYRWYEKELDSINELISKNYEDLDNNFTELSLPENKKENIFKFKASIKRIKTKYGIENNCYESDFEIEASPFDGVIVNNLKDMKSYKNTNEFKNAKFPLYGIRHKGIVYLFEEEDFELVENKNEEVKISYITKWEKNIIKLESRAKKCRKWLNRCLYNIKVDTCNTYGIPVMRF